MELRGRKGTFLRFPFAASTLYMLRNLTRIASLLKSGENNRDKDHEAAADDKRKWHRELEN